jgi:hypothetical protein
MVVGVGPPGEVRAVGDGGDRAQVGVHGTTLHPPAAADLTPR